MAASSCRASVPPEAPRRSSDPRIRSHIVGPMLQHVARAGGDAASLAAQFGLPVTSLTDAEATLPLVELQAFFDAAASVRDVTGRPNWAASDAASPPARATCWSIGPTM